MIGGIVALLMALMLLLLLLSFLLLLLLLLLLIACGVVGVVSEVIASALCEPCRHTLNDSHSLIVMIGRWL